ncbi:putative ribosome biogenesis GTPase RsgA [Bacteroidia bacterium]|nr:putative ribosome biogenesis GTPase RsgA [Bacteroidia bacterium]
MQTGKVILTTGNTCNVETPEGNIHTCTVRGNFRLKKIKSTNPVIVGDVVDFEDNNFIVNIHERHNCIIRRSVNLSHQSHIIAVNIDEVFIIASLVSPTTPYGFIDRFTVVAESFHIPVTIVFNKLDIYDDKALQHLERAMKIYTNVGYRCIAVSAVTNENVETLKNLIHSPSTQYPPSTQSFSTSLLSLPPSSLPISRTVLFAGNSGVGKSTIINVLDSSKNLKTKEISTFNDKGKHTTTFTEMHKVDDAYIIDSPGIKEFGVVHIPKNELHLYFPEFRKLSSNCKFDNCTHTHEPACAVRRDLEEPNEHKHIAPERYTSYLWMLEGN